MCPMQEFKLHGLPEAPYLTFFLFEMYFLLCHGHVAVSFLHEFLCKNKQKKTNKKNFAYTAQMQLSYSQTRVIIPSNY